MFWIPAMLENGFITELHLRRAILEYPIRNADTRHSV
jgi:hypothetical protein